MSDEILSSRSDNLNVRYENFFNGILSMSFLIECLITMYFSVQFDGPTRANGGRRGGVRGRRASGCGGGHGALGSVVYF